MAFRADHPFDDRPTAMTPAPSRLAMTAMDLYNALPSNGKPKLTEFTVLASVIASVRTNISSSDATDLFVISLATGTKCIGNEYGNKEGNMLHDSHAEILARRALVHFLLTSLLMLQKDRTLLSNPYFPLTESNSKSAAGTAVATATSTPLLQIKDSWKFHLYISDSPCGDASIYNLINGESNFTGAKIRTAAAASTSCCHGSIDSSSQSSSSGASASNREQGDQQIGAVRTKSGRSNILAERQTLSLSCSDKICRWLHTGIQG